VGHPLPPNPPRVGCRHRVLESDQGLESSPDLQPSDFGGSLSFFAVLLVILVVGCLEWLAHEELHIPFQEGGLSLSDILAHVQFLLAKQACHCLMEEGPWPITWRTGLAYTCERTFISSPGYGLHTENIRCLDETSTLGTS
jgi:hypothetical protein